MTVQIAGSTMEGLGNLPQNAAQSYQYLLLRLLLGTATVSRSATSRKQTIDYSSLPATPQAKTASIAVKGFLIDYSIGGNVKRFLKATIADNREFYKEILSEFLNFEIHTARRSHTAAFVFLYRILERISYSVPLLYSSTQTDYRGTFRDLKLVLEDAEGELGLFSKFLSQGKFIDPIKLQVVQKISFLTGNFNGDSYYKFTKKRCSGFVISDDVNKVLEIKFSDIHSLLKTIRNRFFHSRTGDGQDNITTIQMIDSDEYFSIINPIIASFLAIVTLQSIASKYHT